MGEFALVSGVGPAYPEDAVRQPGPLVSRTLQTMKSSTTLLPLLIATVLSIGSRASAETTIAYPTADNATFTIGVPDDWELTPAESEDDYFLVTGPTNVELWFRSFAVSSGDEAGAAVEEAMTSGEEWLADNYKGVEFGDPTEGDRDGMPFISLVGKGVEKESGEAVTFTIAFLFMKNGSMAEFWGIIPVGDADGKAAAQAIVDSFEAQ